MLFTEGLPSTAGAEGRAAVLFTELLPAPAGAESGAVGSASVPPLVAYTFRAVLKAARLFPPTGAQVLPHLVSLKHWRQLKMNAFKAIVPS